MVYVEYNNSKKIEIEKELEYEVSSSLGNSELLAFAPAFEYYPNNSFIADGRAILDNDYLMSFNAIKTYIKKDYSFLYRNKYYKFNTEIKKGDNVYLNKGEQIDNFEILGETTQDSGELFDKNNINKINAYFESSGDTIKSSNGNRVVYIECQPNTSYIITQGNSSLSNHVLQIATTTETPAIGVTVYDFINIGTTSTYTYTTNNTAQYLVFRIRGGDDTSTYWNNFSIKSLPSPNNPIPIINKTGTVTQTIQGEEYTFNLGSIELCKIGTYQDKIYKSNGKWYLHKEIGKVVLDGSETIESSTAYTGYYRYLFRNLLSTTNVNGMNNRFTQRTTQAHGDYEYLYIQNNGSIYIQLLQSRLSSSSVDDFKTWLSNNNTIVYYVLSTPTNTEITDTTLLNQLENVYEVGDLVLEGYTNNKVILPVYDELQLNKSGSETSFSEVKADFGNRTIENLPMAYQEVRIWDGELIGTQDLSNCELLFTGYLDKASVTQKHRKTDECDLELSLLSPMNLSTKRYVTITGTYNIYDLFIRILSPLISDGFEIEKIDVNSSDITVKYYMETVETIMNDLSNKLNIFWVINEFKKISIYDINKLFNSSPKITIADELDGLYKIAPVIENTNYFNTVNIKNARVYSTDYNSNILDIMKLIQDESLEFVNPVDFGVEGAERVYKNNGTSTCTILKIVNSSNNTLYDIKYQNGQIVLPSGVVFSDEDTENATMVLQRDSFFSNLVTGIDWRGNTQTLKTIQSDTVLKYQLFKYYNSDEIEKCSNYITNSGIIEQTIDVNEAWFTYNELIDYCSNLIIANSNIAGSVELAFDKKYDVNIGDKIRITMPEFLINGDFIVTEKNETIEKEAEYDCQIKAQNNQLLYNYIDIFRKQITEVDEEKYNNINIVNYVDDKITEKHIQTEV